MPYAPNESTLARTESNATSHGRPLDAWAVTGAIAAGKTTVLNALARHGFAILDSDAVVGELYRDPVWRARIAAHIGWPVEPFTAAGRPKHPANAARWRDLDRPRLREHLLAHPEHFETLERLLHPEVWVRIQRWRATQTASQHCAVAVPLLFESGWASRFTRIIIVTAPAEQRRARALGRPGMTPVWLDAIERRQWDDTRRLAAAATLDAITVHNPDCDDNDRLERAIARQVFEHAREAAALRADQGYP